MFFANDTYLNVWEKVQLENYVSVTCNGKILGYRSLSYTNAINVFAWCQGVTWYGESISL